VTRTRENVWERGGLPLHELGKNHRRSRKTRAVATVSGWVTQNLADFPKWACFQINALSFTWKKCTGHASPRLKLTRRPATLVKSPTAPGMAKIKTASPWPRRLQPPATVWLSRNRPQKTQWLQPDRQGIHVQRAAAAGLFLDQCRRRKGEKSGGSQSPTDEFKGDVPYQVSVFW